MSKMMISGRVFRAVTNFGTGSGASIRRAILLVRLQLSKTRQRYCRPACGKVRLFDRENLTTKPPLPEQPACPRPGRVLRKLLPAPERSAARPQAAPLAAL